VPLISHVQIENYKSIEKMEFEARRVNVFIGGPNAGKSNILEALALMSPGLEGQFKEIFRVTQGAELFRDQAIELPSGISLNHSWGWSIKFDQSGGRFQGDVTFPNGAKVQPVFKPQTPGARWHSEETSPVRFYTYQRRSFANGQESQYKTFHPPFGQNLPSLLFSDKSFRESISALFKAHGHRLEIRPQSNEILISKEIDDVLYSYPFDAVSETLRRIVFYKAVLETNRDRVLILDEPEANTFPFYTKWLAERIALDESNQFFLTTHNPYVLMSIIQKTPMEDLAILVTRMRDYRTEIRPLTHTEFSEAMEMGMDIFLNLDRYFDEE
jgi:hypothetical protein